MIDRLRNIGNGAHVHAANKCSFYIQIFLEQKKDPSTLIYLANKAIISGDWQELQKYMSKWW